MPAALQAMIHDDDDDVYVRSLQLGGVLHHSEIGVKGCGGGGGGEGGAAGVVYVNTPCSPI